MATTESARDRRALVKEAGHGTTSFVSVLAGTLVAFGAVALVAAIAGAIGSQLGLTTDGISTSEYRDAGMVGAAVTAVVLLVAFFFGGYVAGRMSRRAGFLHGVLVFVLAALVVAAVAGLAAWLGDPDSVRSTLSDSGVPTDANTWSDIGIGAGIAALVAMLVGSILGGIRGDRWHGRIVTMAEEHRRERHDHEVRGSGAVVGRDATTVVDVRDDDREESLEDELERTRSERS
jgi:hypothetical protein